MGSACTTRAQGVSSAAAVAMALRGAGSRDPAMLTETSVPRSPSARTATLPRRGGSGALFLCPCLCSDRLSSSRPGAAPWWSSPSPWRHHLGPQPKEETMTEEGTLSIVGQPQGYGVCYASNDAYGLERQPATGLDAAGLATLLAACGVGPWAIHQAGAELHAGRMAILPLVCTRAQLDATFPHVPP